MRITKCKFSISKISLSILLCMNYTGLSIAQDIMPDTLRKVNIAYETHPEWMITGAVSSVKEDELSKTFATNLLNTLYGKLPGLFVGQTSGEPGNDSPILNSRGIGTFGSGSDIFVVIDGFPSDKLILNQLTVQEIESISLLKDASATAIYGSRGANGVLLVTTKRGTASPMKIKFGVQYGLQQATRLPEFLDSHDYAKLYNEALRNDGQAEKYSQTELDAYKNGTDPVLYPNVNWYDQVLRDVTPMSNYSLSAIGGGNSVRYAVILNVLNNQGIYKKTENESLNTKNFSYNKYSYRTNVDISLSKRLTAAVTLGGSVEDRVNPGRERNGISGEYSSNIFNLLANVAPNSFPVRVDDNRLGGSSLYYNPWGEITQTGYYSTRSRTAQMAAKLTGDLGMITPGLSVSGSVGFNTYFKSYSVWNRNYARYSSERDQTTNDLIHTVYGEDTSLNGNESQSSQWRSFVLQSFLNYNRVFDSHGVSAMLMTEYEENTISGVDLPFKSINSGGRFTYSFDKKYIGEFSFGYSGGDNFASGDRFGFFPAASVGWIASEENFLKENEIIHYLKLRASYGLTGNKNTGDRRFSYIQYYGGRNYYLGTTNSSIFYLLESALANKNATWEKAKKTNIGFDAAFLKNNALSVSFDYFRENRYDILTKPSDAVAQYLGFSLSNLNIGKVENSGFEAIVRYNAAASKDLSYFTEASAWYARNKIKYNAEAPKLYDYQYSTGLSIGTPFVLESIGFYEESDFNADGSLKNGIPVPVFEQVKPGDLKYKNQNDDNVIDGNDFVPMGYSSIPEVTLALRAGIKYKSFDFEALFQGALNRTVYRGGNYYHAFQNDGQVSSVALGRWTPETASSATYPRLSANNNMNNYQRSSFWQENGNFLKLRNLEIGYSLPENVKKKLSVENVRVFFNGTNLFSFDHMDSFTDPEVLTGYPAMRIYSLGLNVQF